MKKLTLLLAVTATLTTTAAYAQNVVHIKKRNAQNYAIDGNRGGANGQSVYLWNQNPNNANQQWIEINRGSGYYSYQKRGTDHCLDGGRGGANRQDVYLWECSDNNQNQHWQKVSTDTGFYQLRKRNASGFAINGGSNGADGQNVNLYNSSSTSSNLQWSIETVGESGVEGESELISHNFNNGNLGPFEPCTVASPNYSRVENRRVTTYWSEDGYRGNRTTRGAEFCEVGRSDGEEVELRFHKYGWMGFTMNLDRMNQRNTRYAVAQIMGYRNWDSDNRFNTWSFLLNIDNGDLVVDHRPGSGTPTIVTIAENFEHGVDQDIVLGFVNSGQQNGSVKVWLNGRLIYNATDINFGMSPFNNSDVQDFESHSAFKLGMYNYNSDEYINGEERAVYYDDVSWYTGPNGYGIVNPR